MTSKGSGVESVDATAVAVRSDLRMIASLARQPAWVDSLTPEMRTRVVTMLHDVLARTRPKPKPREVMGVAKCLALLERNDLDRAKWLTSLVVEDDDDQDPPEGEGAGAE